MLARLASAQAYADRVPPDLMPSTRRYTILVADRQTGVVRRFTVGLRPALAVVVAGGRRCRC